MLARIISKLVKVGVEWDFVETSPAEVYIDKTLVHLLFIGMKMVMRKMMNRQSYDQN
jgi:hypothetical protein